MRLSAAFLYILNCFIIHIVPIVKPSIQIGYDYCFFFSFIIKFIAIVDTFEVSISLLTGFILAN